MRSPAPDPAVRERGHPHVCPYIVAQWDHLSRYQDPDPRNVCMAGFIRVPTILLGWKRRYGIPVRISDQRDLCYGDYRRCETFRAGP